MLHAVTNSVKSLCALNRTPIVHVQAFPTKSGMCYRGEGSEAPVTSCAERVHRTTAGAHHDLPTALEVQKF